MDDLVDVFAPAPPSTTIGPPWVRDEPDARADLARSNTPAIAVADAAIIVRLEISRGLDID